MRPQLNFSVSRRISVRRYKGRNDHIKRRVPSLSCIHIANGFLFSKNKGIHFVSVDRAIPNVLRALNTGREVTCYVYKNNPYYLSYSIVNSF